MTRTSFGHAGARHRTEGPRHHRGGRGGGGQDGGPSTTRAGGGSAAAQGEYNVRRGDTLAKLARKFGTTVDALASANGIKDPNTIMTGQKLKLTGSATGSSGGGTPASPPAPAAAPTTAAVPATSTPPPAGGALATSIAAVDGDSSTAGLDPAAARPFDLAHKTGLKLISGKREQRDSHQSDHTEGKAIDMSNVGSGTTTGSPQMQGYADDLRARAKSGDMPEVKYVIYYDKIANAGSNWEWKPFTPASGRDPNDPTERHTDHVHVSLN